MESYYTACVKLDEIGLDSDDFSSTTYSRTWMEMDRNKVRQFRMVAV